MLTKAEASGCIYLNGWLGLTDSKLSMSPMCATDSFTPGNVTHQILLPPHEAVIREFPSVWVNLAKTLQFV